MEGVAAWGLGWGQCWRGDVVHKLGCELLLVACLGLDRVVAAVTRPDAAPFYPVNFVSQPRRAWPTHKFQNSSL